MFEWFKNLFTKKEISVPVEVADTEVIRVKIKDNAPQVKDYPRSLYKAYWEIYHSVEGQRHTGKVRFWDFTGNLLSESTLTAGSYNALFDKVNALITAKMESFKR